MAGSGWLLVMVGSILGAAFLFATDPDRFSVPQLWDLTAVHHELLEVILVAVAVIAAWGYVRANRPGNEGVILHGPG